jgi:hypothetical protein
MNEQKNLRFVILIPIIAGGTSAQLGRAPVPIQNFEECKEAIDKRAVLNAFNAPNSGTEAPAPAEGANDRGASLRKWCE